MRKLLGFGLVFGVVVGIAPATAMAHGGPPVVVFTDSVRGTTIEPFSGPCTPPGTVVLEFHSTFHVTLFADGHQVVIDNTAGRFSYEPDDPTAPGATGRYRTGSSFTDSQNATTFTSVFTVTGRNDDGERVRFKIHQRFTFANGEVRVDDVDVRCT